MSKLNAPEVNISIYGFLLNFVWEIWQAPLFEGMDDLTHFEVTLHCTFAALGDVVILLVAFWASALARKIAPLDFSSQANAGCRIPCRRDHHYRGF